MTQLSDKLSVKEKIGYAMGDVASNLFWMVFVFFGMYFYTDVFGLSAAAVGTMFGVTRLVDAIIEPSIGLLSDRTRTRWGKRRPSTPTFGRFVRTTRTPVTPPVPFNS